MTLTSKHLVVAALLLWGAGLAISSFANQWDGPTGLVGITLSVCAGWIFGIPLGNTLMPWIFRKLDERRLRRRPVWTCRCGQTAMWPRVPGFTCFCCGDKS